ncbi:MAG: SMC-Scp complex subunit ScpB [Clostridiales Family XIII bacterium]|jgi:segregation and condensation protein B|nr:SMC-Scp complex subunit ScpB [Clostridiales Family XIII bacterium]
MFSRKAAKSAFESMLFVWGEPLDAKMAADAIGMDLKTARECFRELQDEYGGAGRGVEIREIDGAFQFVTRAENFDYVKRLCTPVKERRLSQSALEALAIIAYRQPVTKGEIDSIRGVKCDRVVEGLARKGLVEEKGRSAAVGRPTLYGTTRDFLRHFGFESLDELPDIDDIEGAIHEPDGDVADGSEQIEIDLGAAAPGGGL